MEDKMSDWKMAAALAGLGAGVLWLVRSRRELSENVSGTGDEDPLPTNAPTSMKVIYKLMSRNAKKIFKEDGPYHIHWSIGPDQYEAPGEWALCDNTDRVGCIIGKKKRPSDRHCSIFIYRLHRDMRMTFGEAKDLAKEFFDEHPNAPWE